MMLKNIFNLMFASKVPKSSRLNRKPKRKKKEGAARISGASFAPSDSESFSAPKILVAHIDGDQGEDVSARITACLDDFQAYEIFKSSHVLKRGEQQMLVDQLVAAAEKGRGWMAEEGASLLIWGSIKGDKVELRFLPMQPLSETQPGAFGLGDTLILPLTFSGELKNVLHAIVLSAVGPTFQGMRSKIASELDQALQKIRPLVEEKPAELFGADYAATVSCIGNAFAAHTLLGGPVEQLDRAVTAYKTALQNVTLDADPVVWAVTQNHLGTALKVKGERTKDVDVLKQAVRTYKAIVDQLNRVEHPFDWALANINIGLVLYRVGTISSKGRYYQEATKSFDEALTIYTQEGTPAKWSEVSNQYGIVLLALGEQVTGNATLERAIEKFRAALGVRKRDVVPVLWAQTANNLGAACFSLAKRNSETTLLHEAQSCFEGAIEIYSASGASKKANVIANNLSRVRRMLLTYEGAK